MWICSKIFDRLRGLKMFKDDFDELNKKEEVMSDFEMLRSQDAMTRKILEGQKSDEPEPVKEEPKEKKGCCSCLFSFKLKKNYKEVDEDLRNKEDIKNAPGV